jgi:hypothetical protein
MVDVTTNYGFVKPDPTDSMEDFPGIANANWDKFAAINSSRIVASLPTTGSYVTGDRVYLTPDQSIYICVANDSNWGIIWKPIQKAMSPWRSLSSSCLATPASWSVSDATRPLQIAVDNQGNLYWRGMLVYTGGTALAKGTATNVFKPFPFGATPRCDLSFIVGHDTLTVTANTPPSEWEGVVVQFFHDNTKSGVVTALGGNGTGNVRNIYFDGQVEFSMGSGVFETG